MFTSKDRDSLHPFVLTKLAAGIALIVALFATSASARDVVIHAGTLLDGVTDTPRREVSILIQDDRITAVEPGFVKPAGSEIIDLSGQTVMPGFIDCHVHIASKLPSRMNATENWLTHSALDRAFDGAVFVRAMLQQGFTSARDVGGGDDTVAVRDAITAGKIAGPRLWVSLEPLGPTAGHGDPRNGLDPGTLPSRMVRRYRQHAGRSAPPGSGTPPSQGRSDQDHAVGRDGVHRG
jgi:Imidazolonepropionase and related amidohydrolases